MTGGRWFLTAGLATMFVGAFVSPSAAQSSLAPSPSSAPAPAGASHSPYAKGGNPLSDPNFVPIMVNSQNVGNAKIYAAAGVNVYDSVDDIREEPNEPYQFKPTADTLKMLSDQGVYLIAEQDVWKGQMANPTIIGWVSPVDEPDNVQDGGKAMPLDKYMEQSNRIKQTDPTRPYFVCFGQGVANEAFRGRGAKYEDYPKYMEVVDFIEYDVYPITNIRSAEGEKHLEMVGQGVSKIRKWTDNKKPVMCWIETTHIKDPNHAPTPAQTACEVWITMVHGARGVGYFCHDFTVKSRGASTLSRDANMLAQLKITNAKLKQLATVISAPLASEPEVAKSSMRQAEPFEENRPGVVFSTKKVGDDIFVLAVNTSGSQYLANIPVAAMKKGQKVEAIEGKGTFSVGENVISDLFGPYQEHVYKIAK